jgi:hypothetical protein
MQNLRINKVMAGLAVLVVSVGILLHFSEKSFQKTPARLAPAEPTVSQTPSSTAHSPRPSEAAASVLETEEVVAVDFDWRQTLTNETPPPKLPREEIEKYLEHNQRNAASLLSAYRALGDTNYLKEATLNFPNDARVQLSVLARDVFPEDRRKWLDLFKASSPDNSLANYLSARDYLKNGQSGLAASELLEAAGKPGFQDYAMESKLDDEELNMAAGRSSIQARLSSSGWVDDHLPELASLKGLAQDMARWQQQYLSAGGKAEAENLAQMGLTLASRLNSGDGGKFVIDQLVGRAVEAVMLSQLDPNASYDFLSGKSPNDRLAELKEQKASLTALRQNFRDALPNMTEAELLSYTERQRISGELEAMRWLQQRRNSTNGQERTP